MQVDGVERDLDRTLGDVARALGTGRLEEATALLGGVYSLGERETRLASVLSKRLIKEEKFEDALLFARRAWLGDTTNLERLLDFGWALRKAGKIDKAIEIFDQAAELAPGRVDIKKNLVSWLTQANRLEEAAPVAAEIAELEPDDFDGVFFRANILRQIGQTDVAVAVLRETLTGRNASIDEWQRFLSFGAAYADPDQAMSLARELSERWPESEEVAKRASSIASRAGRTEDAVYFARRAVALNSQNPAAHRRLSSLLTGIRFNSEAFEHAMIAARLAPDEASFRVFLASHFRRAGRLADAMSELSVALMLEPQNRDALLDLITVLQMRGQSANGDMVRRQAEAMFPNDPAFSPGGGNNLDEEYWDDPNSSLAPETDQILERLALRADRRWIPKTRFGRWIAPLRDQARVTWALIMRETKTRFGKAGWGYAWALIEPIMHIALLGASMAFFRGDHAPLGHYYIVFHITGIVIYLMFIATSTHLTTTLRNTTLLKLPLVHLNDIFFAKAILELLIGIVVEVVLLFGCFLAGYDYWPNDPLGMLTVMFVTWVMAIGIGITNCMVALIWEPWDMLWINVARVLYFISGMFYLAEYLPPYYLKYLMWNPLLHSLTWNRAAFYHNYTPFILSRGYLVAFAVVALTVGLVLERIMRRRTMVYV